MKKAGKSMEECARSAWQLRRDNRLKSRDFMRNAGSGSDVDLLEARDLKKYGDKNGPSFDYLVKKGLEESGKKAADDEIYQAIVASANRTNKWVNAWNTAVDYCSWAWNGFQAETKQCQLTHK